MVLVREIFQVKFGRMKEALSLVREAEPMMRDMGQSRRLLTDLSGPYYTLVLEASFASLAEFEQRLRDETNADQWRAWYQKFTPLIDSGRREMFTIVGQ